MFFFKHLLLCLILIIYSVAESTNAHEEPTLSCNDMAKEFEVLKASNEILKLYLENIELKMDNRMTKFEYKLEAIEEQFNKLKATPCLGTFQCNSVRPEDVGGGDLKENKYFHSEETLKDYDNAGNINRDGMDGNSNREVIISTPSINREVIISTPSINTPQLDLVRTENVSKAYLNGNEEPMLCIRNEQQKLMCSNITLPTSCSTSNGMNCYENKCRIQNNIHGLTSFVVPCDFNTDGCGWTVIQRRVNSSVDFYRNWSDYKNGFGDLDGNYWIGLEKLYALTTSLEPVELYIKLQDWSNVVKYAKYDSFEIGNERTMYTLKSLGNYSGNAGDSLRRHLSCKFSTKDHDNEHNCALERHGAWWYKDCTDSNLNGRYYEKSTIPSNEWGMSWLSFHGLKYSLKFVQMMIRQRKL